jgi:hypothetical protein
MKRAASSVLEDTLMTRAILLALPLLLVSQLAHAADAGGHDAFALAAVVAEHSPTLSASDKSVMAALFDGHGAPYPAGKKISVRPTP